MASELTIYDEILIGDPLWFSSAELQKILNENLVGFNLSGLALRTRSKVCKAKVCEALGYPVPKAFRRTQPRFPGQNFDTYVQKSNNLQVWNEELSATRRYVVIRVDELDTVVRIRVVNGAELAKLDTTGNLTKKYQARVTIGSSPTELVSLDDTPNLKPVLGLPDLSKYHPTDIPAGGDILPIAEVFSRLSKVVGISFPDVGSVQERNRGASLHGLVCKAIGYANYGDTGQFPDIKHQLIEIKLQTSPTIDLGLVLPSSSDALDIPRVAGQIVRHCDVRYVICYAKIEDKMVTVTHLMVSTGQDFFTRFTQFQGKASNSKLQIPLPSDFFDL